MDGVEITSLDGITSLELELVLILTAFSSNGAGSLGLLEHEPGT